MNLLNTFIDRLAALRADRAKHVIAGGLVAGIASPLSVVLVAPVLAPKMGLAAVFVIGGIVAVASAWAIGWWKEYKDAEDNAARIAAGLEPVHEVSQGDIVATTIGGMIISTPMFILAMAGLFA